MTSLIIIFINYIKSLREYFENAVTILTNGQKVLKGDIVKVEEKLTSEINKMTFLSLEFDILKKENRWKKIR